MRYLLIILALPILLLAGCKKESESNNYTSLKEGIKANNVQQVKEIITAYINTLPSNDYTEATINKLVSVISGECTVTAGAFCFDCIQTLPSQSEIWIEVKQGSTTVRKTIDITYTTPANKMKFGNMHD